jgi:hypothetical protein
MVSRTIVITLPAGATEALLAELGALEGVVGLSLQRGVSFHPPGDVLTAHASNEGAVAVLELLDGKGIGAAYGSVVTSEPRSVRASDGQPAIDDESNEMGWQEMAYQLGQETNISTNYLLIMLLAGAVAAAGLWTDTVHIVIGAMVIAPGFAPIIRTPFGLIGKGGNSARNGIYSTAAGYLTLALGAAVSLLVLRWIEPSPVSLGELYWVQYWSSIKPSGVLIALLAGVAGAVVISAGRSVLTAGVMIALALIPSMAIVGMGTATGDFGLAWNGLLRWATDAACVAAAGGGLFLAKRLRHADG